MNMNRTMFVFFAGAMRIVCISTRLLCVQESTINWFSPLQAWCFWCCCCCTIKDKPQGDKADVKIVVRETAMVSRFACLHMMSPLFGQVVIACI